MEKDKDKKNKEEKQKEEKEKEDSLRKEIESIMETYEKNKMSMKLPVLNQVIEGLLKHWSYKFKNKDHSEYLGLSTCKAIDHALREKDFANFYEGYSSDNKVLLIKVFHGIYERIANKSEVFQIKSSKLLLIQNKLTASEGMGGVARALFSIQSIKA
jgi:hypothetical protein